MYLMYIQSPAVEGKKKLPYPEKMVFDAGESKILYNPLWEKLWT